MPRMQVVKVTGAVILEWPNGMRIQVAPEGLVAAGRPIAKPKGRPGRKPSPAAQAVINAMEADHAAAKQRTRKAYLEVLRRAGYDGSDAAASQILAREATRIFGKTLGRTAPKKKARKRVTKRTAKGARRRPGRKPAPATQAVIDAMEADHAAGKQRSRPAYLDVLRGAGYDGSDAAASQILVREATRIFGQILGRGKTKAARKTAKRSTGRGGGRQPSKPTVVVRQKIEADAASDQLGDATHYVRWLVKQKGVKIGLKGARPIVYRELRKVRA